MKLIAFAILIAATAQAQTLQEAIKKTDNERYDLARKEFQTLVKADPTNVDNSFYFGNFYQIIGEKDSAIMQWKVSGAINLEDKFSQLSAAKAIYFSGDTATAGKAFCAIIKATKSKNAIVFQRIGETYATAPIKNLRVAESNLRMAIKLDPKNFDATLMLGDVLLEQSTSNASQATEQYNNALAINPKAANVIVRKAKIYQRTQNYKLANEEYKRAQALDPTYAPAYRENAELNFLFDQYDAAIECWQKYIALNDSDEARYRYAGSLFSAKRYKETLEEIERLEKNKFMNFYTKRMLIYSLYETNEALDKLIYERALSVSDDFMKIVPKDKVISSDFTYRSNIYSKLGNDSLAIQELEKAAVLDTAKAAEYLQDIAKLYGKSKNYTKVIETYVRKERSYPTKMEPIEYYELGRAYYFGPKNYVLADSSFARLIRLSPTFSGGYLWKARSSIKLEDPKNNKWMSQPFYEGYLTAMTEEEKASGTQKSLIIEASKYLGDYYINSANKNKEKAKENWERVRTLDPADTQAKAFFASPAGR